MELCKAKEEEMVEARTKGRRRHQSRRHSPGRRSRAENPSAEPETHVGKAQCRIQEVGRDEIVEDAVFYSFRTPAMTHEIEETKKLGSNERQGSAEQDAALQTRRGGRAGHRLLVPDDGVARPCSARFVCVCV